MKSWHLWLLVAIILAFASSILALIAPDKLSGLTDIITEGIKPNTEKLEVIINDIGNNVGVTDEEVNYILTTDEISSEDKEIFLNVLNDIQDGYTAFSLSVDSASTYGNSIHKNDYIDLWFKGEDDTNKIIYANLVESIRVLDVRDSTGVSLENSETGTPSELLFAVPDELYSLLVKAESVGELEAVPRNRSYTANPGETRVASEYVRNFILSKSATIPDENTGSNTTTTDEE